MPVPLDASCDMDVFMTEGRKPGFRYFIKRSCIRVTQSYVDWARNRVEQVTEDGSRLTIFNSRSRNGKQTEKSFGDNKRHQTEVTATAEAMRIYTKLEQVLTDEGFMTSRVMSSTNLVWSEPGCIRQRYHNDYDLATHPVGYGAPGSVLLALEDNTFLWIEGTRYELKKGDMAEFGGFVTHCGAAYSVRNIRFHLYLNGTRGNEQHRIVNQTTYDNAFESMCTKSGTIKKAKLNEATRYISDYAKDNGTLN